MQLCYSLNIAKTSKNNFTNGEMKDGLEILIDYNEDKSSDVGNNQEATIFIETLGMSCDFIFFVSNMIL